MANLETLGLTPSKKTGRMPAIRLEDKKGRYILSFIPNRSHLLFYLRHPALKLHPELPQMAIDAGLEVVFNPAEEGTIRLESLADAKRLVSWLETTIPL